MNKKLFFSLFAATGMLFATSCSNDELECAQSGNEAQVTFSLGLEGGIATRAISDGTGAKKLVCAIYNANDANNKVLLDKVVINNTQVDENGQYVNTSAFQGGLKDNIKITLAKGQSYTMVFWAQDGACDAYDTDDLTAVKVDYTNGAETDPKGDINNDETRDAFYAAVPFEVNGDKEINVTLKRPFAQINVGVTAEDWEAAVASGITIEKSSVVIKNAATSINLLTGEVGEETTDVTVTYTANAIPQDEMLKVDTDDDGVDEEYHWLSMSYILAADHDETPENGLLGTKKATLQGLQYTFIPKNGESIAFAEGLASAPVRRNWRTNILGKILTGDVQFNITIDPAYDGDYIYPDGTTNQELIFAATFGGTYTMNGKVDLETRLDVNADFILEGQGNALNITNATNYGVRVFNGTTTLNNVNITSDQGGVSVANGAKAIFNSGSVKTGANTNPRYNFYVTGTGSTATINGGDFSFTKTLKRAYIYADAGTTVYVNGGNFGVASTRDGYTAGILGTGTVIITGGTFGFDPTTWVADGYKAVKSGEKWYVVANDVTVASTSNEVETAFANGGTVLLASDIELDARLDVAAGANVNLDMNGKTITLKGTSVDPAFYTYKGSTLTITGNGKVEINDPSVSLIFPGGDVVIENCTFVRNIPAGTPADQVGAFFVGAKVSPWGSQTVTINGGYFDGGYYDANAADIDEILAGTKTFTETADDIAKRGNSGDKNSVRVAIKNNVQLLLNLSYNLFKVYGGTFVGANPAWGDEGCMLPTTPNYLRPWSYYQGALLDGQVFNENGIVLPVGYAITKGALEDGRPTYTVTYNK